MKNFFKSLTIKKSVALFLVAISLLLTSCSSDEASKDESSLVSEITSSVDSSKDEASSENSSSAESSENAESSDTESSEAGSETSTETSSENSEENTDVSLDVSEENSSSVENSEADESSTSSETEKPVIGGVGDKNSIADLNKIPAYSGDGYVVIANGVPFFTSSELSTKGYEKYGNLDSLGRCTSAIACVGKDTMPTEDRGSISSVKPTGWIQAKYSCIKTSDLYNRSHLIAWSLSGENANKQNLVTGTAYLNQDIMTQFEDMVLDYIKETGNHVAYRSTPLFKGNELVCRGIQMEAYSVEDGGKGICFNVFCYNVQPGVVIDYATGKSHEEGKENEPDNDNSSSANGNVKADYVLNKKTKKIHIPECSSVANMSEKNREDYNGTLNSLLAEGYVPCGSCNAGQ